MGAKIQLSCPSYKRWVKFTFVFDFTFKPNWSNHRFVSTHYFALSSALLFERQSVKLSSSLGDADFAVALLFSQNTAKTSYFG